MSSSCKVFVLQLLGVIPAYRDLEGQYTASHWQCMAFQQFVAGPDAISNDGSQTAVDPEPVMHTGIRTMVHQVAHNDTCDSFLNRMSRRRCVYTNFLCGSLVNVHLCISEFSEAVKWHAGCAAFNATTAFTSVRSVVNIYISTYTITAILAQTWLYPPNQIASR